MDLFYLCLFVCLWYVWLRQSIGDDQSIGFRELLIAGGRREERAAFVEEASREKRNYLGGSGKDSVGGKERKIE